MSTVDDAIATMIGNFPARTGRPLDDAIATMIGNFPARTGRPLDEWVAMVRADGLPGTARS